MSEYIENSRYNPRLYMSFFDFIVIGVLLYSSESSSCRNPEGGSGAEKQHRSTPSAYRSLQSKCFDWEEVCMCLFECDWFMHLFAFACRSRLIKNILNIILASISALFENLGRCLQWKQPNQLFSYKTHRIFG